MSTTKTAVKTAAVKRVRDPQTGKEFDVIPESRIDVAFAWISAAYSLAVIGYLAWLVLDILYRQSATAATPAASPSSGSVAAWLMPILSQPTSKLIFYTAIGGAIGAAVNNLRSFIAWHAEERAFGWRFIWKYLAMPPLGGTLAVLVYGILQGGMAVFNGGVPASSAPTTASQVTSLSAWVTGTLAGYGSHSVFKWLDDKVNTLFKFNVKQVAAPDVKGKSLEEAKQMVANAELEVGKISEAPASDDQVGKVIAQSPEAGTQIDCGSKMDLTVGIAAGQQKDASTPGKTELADKPQGKDAVPQDGQPVKAGETEKAGKEKTVGTVTGEKGVTAPEVTSSSANPAPDSNAAKVDAGSTTGAAVSSAVVGAKEPVNTENTSVESSSDNQEKTDASSAAAGGGNTDDAETDATGDATASDSGK